MKQAVSNCQTLTSNLSNISRCSSLPYPVLTRESAANSIQISYQSENGITTEELMSFGIRSNFNSEEIEDVETFPIVENEITNAPFGGAMNCDKSKAEGLDYDFKMIALNLIPQASNANSPPTDSRINSSVYSSDSEESVFTDEGNNVSESKIVKDKTDAQVLGDNNNISDTNREISYGAHQFFAQKESEKIHEVELETHANYSASEYLDGDESFDSEISGLNYPDYAQESTNIVKKIQETNKIPKNDEEEQESISTENSEEIASLAPMVENNIPEAQILNPVEKSSTGEEFSAQNTKSIENEPLSLDIQMESDDENPPLLSPNYNANVETLSLRDSPPSLSNETQIFFNYSKVKKPKKSKNFNQRRKVKNSQQRAQTESKSEEIVPKKVKKERVTDYGLLPHSSAEIQERVKNRHRNKVLAFTSYEPPKEPKEPKIVKTPERSKNKNGEVQESRARPKRRQTNPPPSSSTSSKKRPKLQDGIFIVEKILKKKVVNGNSHFFIKWLNYPSHKNTWEPAENFSPDLIAAYERNFEGAPKTDSSSLVSNTKTCEKKPGNCYDNSSETQKNPPNCSPAPKSPNLRNEERINGQISYSDSDVPKTSIARKIEKASSGKCSGCTSYPLTFTDQRNDVTGFDLGFKYHKSFESFVLDGHWCALVEFEEKDAYELIAHSVINEKLNSKLKLN